MQSGYDSPTFVASSCCLFLSSSPVSPYLFKIRPYQAPLLVHAKQIPPQPQHLSTKSRTSSLCHSVSWSSDQETFYCFHVIASSVLIAFILTIHLSMSFISCCQGAHITWLKPNISFPHKSTFGPCVYVKQWICLQVASYRIKTITYQSWKTTLGYLPFWHDAFYGAFFTMVTQ